MPTNFSQHLAAFRLNTEKKLCQAPLALGGGYGGQRVLLAGKVKPERKAPHMQKH